MECSKAEKPYNGLDNNIFFVQKNPGGSAGRCIGQLKKKKANKNQLLVLELAGFSPPTLPFIYLFVLHKCDDGLHWKHALPMSVLIKWLTSMKCTNTQGPPFKFLKDFSYHALS